MKVLAAVAGALFETRLQGPDVLDVAGNAPRDGELFALHVEHRVHCLIQRRNLRFPVGLELFPVHQHFVPEQRGEQEAWGNALVAANAVVGIGQRQHHEFLAHRLFENDVEQRQQAVVQALVAQLGDAFDRMALISFADSSDAFQYSRQYLA